MKKEIKSKTKPKPFIRLHITVNTGRQTDDVWYFSHIYLMTWSRKFLLSKTWIPTKCSLWEYYDIIGLDSYDINKANSMAETPEEAIKKTKNKLKDILIKENKLDKFKEELREKNLEYVDFDLSDFI